MGFDNLNSLETLNLQNNKLQHIPEEIMEPILDTLRVVDIMGKDYNVAFAITILNSQETMHKIQNPINMSILS
jgi:Leucine-rich repeat (LRR) protein